MRAKKLEVEVVCFVSEINNADDDVSVCCCTSRALNADFFNGIIGVTKTRSINQLCRYSIYGKAFSQCVSRRSRDRRCGVRYRFRDR